MLIDKGKMMMTVDTLSYLEIARWCSRQTEWHVADDNRLTTTIRDLILDLDLQK